MIKIGFAIILIVLVISTISFGVSDSGNLVTTARPVNDPLNAGDIPIIVGNVKDQVGQPIDKAKVMVMFAKETITVYTNNVGSYAAKSTISSDPGHYTVNVVASKDGYGQNVVSTTYFVNGNPAQIEQLNLPVVNEVQTIVVDGITKNPLSQIILQKIEEITKQQAEAEKKRQEIENHQKFLNEQRQLAQKSLRADLKAFEKKHEANSPKNAFARFVADVDTMVQGIFWGQFSLTEQKHNEAYQAKMEALKDGKTSVEATKIFQRKAAVSKSQLIEYNTELNVKHGLADKKTQDKFDEQGKLR
jgi:hypothetical protein